MMVVDKMKQEIKVPEHKENKVAEVPDFQDLIKDIKKPVTEVVQTMEAKERRIRINSSIKGSQKV